MLDDIEDMHPMKEELISDATDSITDGLFGIDDQMVFEMEMDSDLSECLAPNNTSFDSIIDFL